MHHFRDMSAKEALHIAKDESGLTEKEIAVQTGVSVSLVKRYFNRNDTYLPGLEMIHRLCVTFHNDILIRWLDARYEKEEGFCREEITSRLTRAGSTFVDLCGLVGEEDFSPAAETFHETLGKIIGELKDLENLSPHRTFLKMPGKNSSSHQGNRFA